MENKYVIEKKAYYKCKENINKLSNFSWPMNLPF